MKTIEVGVINSVTANNLVLDLNVSSGKLVLPGATSGNSGWGKGLDWKDIKSYERLAYQAGVYSTKRINFGSYGVNLGTAGAESSLSLYFRETRTASNTAVGYATAPFVFTAFLTWYGVYTAAALAELLYTTILGQEGSKLNVSYTSGNTFIDIQGQFLGADNNIDVEVFDFSVTSTETYAPVEKTITAISAAASAVVTSTAHGLTIGDVVEISTLPVWTVEPTAGDFVAGTNYTVTAVPDANNFTINFNSVGATYGSGGGAKDVFIGNTVALVEPRGTAAIVMLADPGAANSSYTYDTYNVVYENQIEGMGDGLLGGRLAKNVIYAKVGLTTFTTAFTKAMTGQAAKGISAVSKAADCVITSANHKLAVGDTILVNGVQWNAAGASLDIAIGLNGQLLTVGTVPNGDTFTVGVDTSGYTNNHIANTGYFIPMKNEYLTK